MSRRATEFQTIRSEGGLLPPDLLRRVLDPKEQLDGTRPEDYGLPQGERLNEVITQSWARLRKHWAEFRTAAANLPAGEAGTGLTNDKWSLPLLRELGFGLLPASAGPEVAGRVYAINRLFGPVPIHLIGRGLSLDHRAAGIRGAAVSNPHGLVQEFLNRSAAHMWGIVSNGSLLRVLRDNQALSRQSFLEFDLEAMFDGELYSDFVLLWIIAHATRFAPREADKPGTCWLEAWTKIANEQGTRALHDLRGGVEKALQILGEGFTAHPKNAGLRDTLRTGQASLADFHAQLLRVVYRFIFLFVAEDRTLDGQSLLHPRDGSDGARMSRELYASNYSTSRLRDLASNIKGSRHGDLWRQFQIIVGALSGDPNFDAAREHLALPALGSFLWDPSSTSTLNNAELTNHDFLEAIRYLAFTRPDKVLRPVDFKNLGAEELGGVYETLLALTPQISADGARFTFAEFAGNERRTSGSYYTPDSLVQCLLDSALDPVVEEAVKGKTGPSAEKAILAVKVCDPAVGSGHFLVGAAHRLARHLARVRAVAQGESEPSPLLYQHALRDVIGHCLYGVDINPMAAELCRVSLWLEAIEPGKPLSFLEHRIQCGNSLLGAAPASLAKGIPDEAFTPIEGDDRDICREFKRVNRDEHNRQIRLFAATTEPWQQLGNLAVSLANLDAVGDDSLAGIREKHRLYEQTIRSSDYLSGRFWADAWCAAFVWKKTREFNYPITEEVFRRIQHNPHGVDVWMRDEIQRLATLYQFFHWHLAFPDVFHVHVDDAAPENEQAGWSGGFDIVLGNPPWERVKLQDKEWFAERSPEIANAPNAAARKRLIEALKADNATLFQEFLSASRIAEGESHFMRNSGRYPLCGRGDINVYAIFAETMRAVVNHSGRVGCVLPSGIATDDTTKLFFQDVVDSKSLVSLFDFENKLLIFESVAPVVKFCLFTCRGGTRPDALPAVFVFFAWKTEDILDADRQFTLSDADIGLLNPISRTCPIFRSARDAELSKFMYRRLPVLGAASPDSWRVSLGSMFHMANDSGLFRTREDLSEEGWRLVGNHFTKDGKEMLPLYEAKLFHQFNHRQNTFEGISIANRFKVKAPTNALSEASLADPSRSAMPRYWVDDREVQRAVQYHQRWLMAFRDMTNVMTNSRNAVFAALPRVGVGHSASLIFSPKVGFEIILGNLNAFVFDYATRQKLAGGHLTFFILKQLPLLPPSRYEERCPWSEPTIPLRDWLRRRVLELTYTGWDLVPFAQECGQPGPPFRWEEKRRFLLRCELDAALFHCYLPSGENGDWHQPDGESTEDLANVKAKFLRPRDAVAYIMDTFPIVKRKDEEKFNGDYRTKRIILEIYDAMAEAIRTGSPYQTRLDAPPADPSWRHPKKEIGILAFGSLIHDPGLELEPKIGMRIRTPTPFPVEYARFSAKRAGGPTLVRHESGSPVSAEILVLDDEVTADQAKRHALET